MSGAVLYTETTTHTGLRLSGVRGVRAPAGAARGASVSSLSTVNTGKVRKWLELRRLPQILLVWVRRTIN